MKTRQNPIIKIMVLALVCLISSSCSTVKENKNRIDGMNEPVLSNKTGKTIIQRVSKNKEWMSDFNIISENGTVIYCDAFDTPENIIDNLKPDIICVTHMQHVEHVDQKLIDKYSNDAECRLSLGQAETFEVKEVKVTGVASSHGMHNNAASDDNKNTIYIFEVDGLRIAHLGGLGQDELNKEQLEKLGKIDIAFAHFVQYGQMDIRNSYNILDILKPQIIIPTHRFSEDEIKKISDIVGNYEMVENVLEISKDDLKDGKRKVIELANTLYIG